MLCNTAHYEELAPSKSDPFCGDLCCDCYLLYRSEVYIIHSMRCRRIYSSKFRCQGLNKPLTRETRYMSNDKLMFMSELSIF